MWSPHCNKDIKLIVSVQQRATKLVSGMQGLQYDERLKQLSLMQFERQRLSSNLIESFKIMNEKYDLHCSLFFQLDDGGRRGHNHKLFKRRFRLNIRKYVLLITERTVSRLH